MVIDMGANFEEIWSSPFVVPYLLKTGDYTVLSSDYFIACDTTGAAQTITLPTAVGITGRRYTIMRITGGVNAVVVDGNGAETINTAANKTLATLYAALSVISDGANWQMYNSQGTVT